MMSSYMQSSEQLFKLEWEWIFSNVLLFQLFCQLLKRWSEEFKAFSAKNKWRQMSKILLSNFGIGFVLSTSARRSTLGPRWAWNLGGPRIPMPKFNLPPMLNVTCCPCLWLISFFKNLEVNNSQKSAFQFSPQDCKISSQLNKWQ
jgi:hypothetical protein